MGADFPMKRDKTTFWLTVVFAMNSSGPDKLEALYKQFQRKKLQTAETSVINGHTLHSFQLLQWLYSVFTNPGR